MPDPKKHSFEALDSERIIDDRWTESKLIAAGYEYHGDGACKSCGDPVSFYKKERGYNQKPQWQVVEDGSMAVHRCQGR